MRTMELLPEIGGHILENTEDITVDVHNPDVNVREKFAAVIATLCVMSVWELVVYQLALAEK